MPFDMKTKKTLDESQKAKDAAKTSGASKKSKAIDTPAADLKQEYGLVPKADKKPAKKESVEAKVAKKEATRKEPVEPEKVAQKVTEGNKDSKQVDYWAVREAVSASHNAAKLDEAKLKTWIKTCEALLGQADFSQAVDIRNSIERFQEAIEALKQPKGLAPSVINGFLGSCANAAKMPQNDLKALIERGEDLVKAASKNQVKDIQGGLEKLYKTSGGDA